MKRNIFWLFLICSIPLFSQDGWFWASPKPTNLNFSDIHFVSSNVGFGVVNNEIFRTNDGGDSWNKSLLPELTQIRAIFFTTVNYGYLIGKFTNDTSVIYKTTNSGNTWTRLNNPFRANTFSSIYFINSTTGWIVGSQGLIIKTTDGGSNWTQQTSGVRLNLYVVKFTSNSIGFAGGDSAVILKTTDGGTHWIKKFGEDQNYVSKISFYMQNVGYANSGSDFIYKTTNAGESWVKMDVNTGYQINTINGLYSFSSTTTIALTLFNTIKTTDGGTTWSVVSDKGGYEICFVGSKGWKTNTKYIIMRSTDSGDNWISLREGIDHTLRRVHFVDFNIGFAIGENKINKSTDGGFTWDEYVTDNNYDSFGSMFFVSSTTGFVGGKTLAPSGNLDVPLLFRTTNQGSTWENINLNNPGYSEITGIHFPSDNIGYAVGRNELFLKTTNGGSSWVKIPTGISFNKNFDKVFFINDLKGWICNSNGTIFKTENGGSSWTETSSYLGGDIKNAFHFVDQNTGYILTENSSNGSAWILKTTNGGLNWSTLSLPIIDNAIQVPKDISFVSPSHFYIATYYGKVLKTTNTGSTWEVLQTPVSEGLFSIHFLTNSLGWVVGLNGLVCKYDKAVFVSDTITIDLWVNNSKSVTIVENGRKVIEGQDYVFPPYTMPSSFRKYQAIYNSLVGSRFYVEQGAIDHNIKINFAITVPSNDSLYGLLGNRKVWFYGIVEVEGHPLGFTFLNTKGAIFKVPQHKDFMSFIKSQGWLVGRQWTFGYYNSNTEQWSGIGIKTYNQKYEDSTIVDTIVCKVTHFSEIGAGDEDLLTNVDIDKDNIIPDKFVLLQNYPNPFNPNTIINYKIPQTSKVKIIIYDLLGKELETLVNAEQSSGSYSIQWNASKYSSGIYFYELRTGEFREIKKMILLK